MIIRNIAALTLLVSAANVAASDFGVVGILDMPTARMRDDGAMTVTSAQQPTVDMYSITYQALPWVEASFRYSIFDPAERLSVNDDLRDRSFGVKARLLEEGRYRPALAAGIRDIFGTGVWAGEYVVASKAVGPVDLSLGMGWGRFAQRNRLENPIGWLDDRLFERKGFVDGDQGQPLDGTFFRGADVGVFGGAEWHLPRWNASLLLEVSSDRYGREIELGHFDDTSPVNYGVRWRPLPGVELTASHQLGQDFAFSVSAQLDTLPDAPRKPRTSLWSPGQATSVSGQAANLNLRSWYDRLLFDVERSGVLLLSADLTDDEGVVWLEIENVDYAYPADAIQRVLTYAELHLPQRVHTINIVLQQDEISEAAISYPRRLGRALDPSVITSDAIAVLPLRGMPGTPRYVTRFRVPNLSTSVSLASRFQIMDPDDPLRYQFQANVSAAADLGTGFFVRASLGINIWNDFEDIDRASNSELPRVRSLVASYLQEGDTGISSLYLEKRGMASDAIAYRAYGGILEDMYSGVGGEVLWRPDRSRFAFGVNANWVRQRDFDRRFSHRDFETVTAHASVYYASPIGGYDFAVHAGRFLARDLGATMEMRRTFDNGWMVGLFATFTDVPFDVFGEGSFDKGLYFRIPFNSILPGNTKGSYNTRIRLLQRDGGQRLEDFGTTLWWDARNSRRDALVRTRSRMIPQ